MTWGCTPACGEDQLSTEHPSLSSSERILRIAASVLTVLTLLVGIAGGAYLFLAPKTPAVAIIQPQVPGSPPSGMAPEAVLDRLLTAIERRDLPGVRVHAKSFFGDRADTEVSAAVLRLRDPVLRAVAMRDVELLYALATARPVFTTPDPRGRLALHLASQGDSGDIVKMLIVEGGTPVDARVLTTGKTALHLAAESGARASIRVLREHGADVNARSNDGSTPLILAAAASNVDGIAGLLDGAGEFAATADLHATNAQGSTALHVAAGATNVDVIRELLRRGADPRT